jgi:hypothetical protein
MFHFFRERKRSYTRSIQDASSRFMLVKQSMIDAKGKVTYSRVQYSAVRKMTLANGSAVYIEALNSETTFDIIDYDCSYSLWYYRRRLLIRKRSR